MRLAGLLFMYFSVRLPLYHTFLNQHSRSVVRHKQTLFRYSATRWANEQHQAGDGQTHRTTHKHIAGIMNAQIDSTECNQCSHTI